MPPSGPKNVKFTIQTTGHAETKLDLPPALLASVTTTNEFSGDIKGSGGAAYIMLFMAHGTEMDGELVFKGTIDGRRGSVIFRVTGHCFSGINIRLTIIPESATDELRGIHGGGGYSTDDPASGLAEGELEIEYA